MSGWGSIGKRAKNIFRSNQQDNQPQYDPNVTPAGAGNLYNGQYYDRDGINESAVAIQAMGGVVRLGDVVDADIADPATFNASSFTVGGAVVASADIVIADQSGDFSFVFYALNGTASTLTVEATRSQYAVAYVANEIRDIALIRHLTEQKNNYLADDDADVWPVDLGEYNLGRWTMFAYRAPGRIILREGQMPFPIPPGQPYPYNDYTLHDGEDLESATSWLRIMAIGPHTILLRGDVIDLSRGQSSGLRVWRRGR